CALPQRSTHVELAQDISKYMRRIRIAKMFGTSQFSSAIPRQFYLPSTNPMRFRRSCAQLQAELDHCEEQMLSRLSSILTSNYRRPQSLLTRAEVAALNQLCMNTRGPIKSVVIKPADKNLGAAVMSLSWYTQQARLHLRDESTYTHI
ncbi:unnamed protein product, partial [Discosporangium mesarthrocarpum]